MKRLLLVDDLPEVREWLARAVEAAFPGASVRHEATLAAGVQAADEESFDLALVDLGLPDGSGIELLRHFQRTQPATLMVVVTVLNQDSAIVSALCAGAVGYLLKEQSAEQTARQLVQLAEGAPPLSPSIARRLIEHFRMTGPDSDDIDSLTAREKEILALISRGYRNRDAAASLGIAETTVASHVKSIYRKLGIATRAEASWQATRLGL